jgi:hypothetical protein
VSILVEWLVRLLHASDIGRRKGIVPDIQSPLDEKLYPITMEHLSKLAVYSPGPVKKAGGTKELLITRYQNDPLYNIFGLDSPEYVGATLAGGSITSIHRKLGDIFEGSVKVIFMDMLAQTAEQITYSTIIMSGDTSETRSADAYLLFDRLPEEARARIQTYCVNELGLLTSNPQINLVGVGMEVRHCYQTGDSKRTQADEALARHFLVSGVLPIMPLFCNQSNPGIVRRYRSVWVIKEGLDSYNMVKEFSGYDFLDFQRRNREDFREPVLNMLRSITR